MFVLTGSWCFYSSVGTPRTVPRPLCSSIGTLRTVPRPFILVLGQFTLSQDLVLGQFVLSQDLSLKCWDTSHCPKNLRPSVGTLRIVSGPFVLVLGHFTLYQDLLLGHFSMSQDYPLRYCDTSYCPKTSHSSVGTLRTVPRLPAQVLGHLLLSQDLQLKCWDTSHCPKTTCSSVGTPRTVPRPPTQVPAQVRLPAQVFSLFVLSQNLFVPVLGQTDLFFFAVGTLRSLSPLPPLDLQC